MIENTPKEPFQSEGEKKFKEWLDRKNYAYLYISQEVNTFPEFFRGLAKRPDFILIVKHFGLIAIDVKISIEKYHRNFILDESEVIKYLEFERISRLPVWFVFVRETENFQNWYWIPLTKVIECPVKESSKTGTPFRVINPSECIILQENRGDGIERLFI